MVHIAMSPSMRREWIEMAEGKAAGVLAEGLPPCGGSGLKYFFLLLHNTDMWSPSMRREWIEMCIGGDKMYILDESPSMRREWIEMIRNL